MDEPTQIQLEWTVEKTLRERPETMRVFMRRGTLCVGCWMQKFCTLKDVAEIYEMDPSEFLQDLNETQIKNSAV